MLLKDEDPLLCPSISAFWTSPHPAAMPAVPEPPRCSLSEECICLLHLLAGRFLTFSVGFLFLLSQNFPGCYVNIFCPSSNMGNIENKCLTFSSSPSIRRQLSDSVSFPFSMVSLKHSRKDITSSTLSLLSCSFYTAFTFQWSSQNLFC